MTQNKPNITGCIPRSVEALSQCIDNLYGTDFILDDYEQALEDLKAFKEALPDETHLKTGLKNAVKPVNETEERGEFALWCGREHNAQAILSTAKLTAEAIKDD